MAIQYPDLQQPPISSGSYQHGEIFIEVDPPYGVVDGITDVLFAAKIHNAEAELQLTGVDRIPGTRAAHEPPIR